jgi:hypothetical protein
VPVHAVGTPVEQERSNVPVSGGPLNGTCHRRWKRGQNVLLSLAAHQQHSVTALFTYVFDVSSGGFEDPQAEEPEHRHQREVAVLGGVSGRGQDGLELQMGEAQGGGLVGDPRPADVVGW